MQLTLEQINKLKEYGFITQVDPSSDILSHSIDTVELSKIWKYINHTDRTEIIEEWLNNGPTPPGPTPTKNYLAFDILSDGKIYWTTILQGQGSHEPDYYKKTIQYSKDNGETWTSITSDVLATEEDFPSVYIEVSTGDTVLIKGNNSHYSDFEGFDTMIYTQFISGIEGPDDHTSFNVRGNIMSLIGGDNFDNLTTLNDPYTFVKIFNYNAGLIDASQLILPATTLTEGCYWGMFGMCNSLIATPALPATTLVSGCYDSMFESCSSLTTAPTLPATTLADYCYSSMFLECSSLTTAPTLSVTALAEGCYSNMFMNCTSLTTAPALPATTLVSGCYGSMFWGCTSLVSAPTISATGFVADADGSCMCMFKDCTSLVNAPVLHATTLATGCYKQMFDGCSSLTTAPELPATVLTDVCYASMFKNCTSLNYIKCLAVDKSATNCTSDWVVNVAPTGTFIGADGVQWSTGNSGIPSGWNGVQNQPVLN